MRLHTSIAIISTQLNGFSYWYQIVIIPFNIYQIVFCLQVLLFNINYLFLCTVNCFQVLLFYTNNSIQYCYLTLIILFNGTHSFAYSLMGPHFAMYHK